MLRTLPDGDVVAAGDLTLIEGRAADRIAYHQQFLQAEPGPNGAFVSLSSSDLLTLVVGVI